MRNRRLCLTGVVLGLLGAVLWLAVRPGHPGGGTPPIGSSRANFERLHEQMTRAEVEAVLGPAGPNYSSDTHRDYYIWKARDGWTRVWIREGKVVRLEFDPTMSGVE